MKKKEFSKSSFEACFLSTFGPIWSSAACAEQLQVCPPFAQLWALQFSAPTERFASHKQTTYLWCVIKEERYFCLVQRRVRFLYYGFLMWLDSLIKIILQQKKNPSFSNYFAIIFFQAISPILTVFLLCLQLLPPAHTSFFEFCNDSTPGGGSGMTISSVDIWAVLLKAAPERGGSEEQILWALTSQGKLHILHS